MPTLEFDNLETTQSVDTPIELPTLEFDKLQNTDLEIQGKLEDQQNKPTSPKENIESQDFGEYFAVQKHGLTQSLDELLDTGLDKNNLKNKKTKPTTKVKPKKNKSNDLDTGQISLF